MKTEVSKEEQKSPSAVQCSGLFGVRTRMVRCFKAGVDRCPKCDLLPVEVTFTSPLGVTHHRFECPECGGDPHVRWDWSHEKAGASWNIWARTPNAEVSDGSEPPQTLNSKPA